MHAHLGDSDGALDLASGVTTVRVGSETAIAAPAVDVPVETFFNGLPSDAKGNEDARTAVTQLAQFAKSKEGSELMTAFSSIKDVRARRQILQLIKTLAPEAE